MILALVLTFIAGFGCGSFIYHVLMPSPVERIRRKARHDLKCRLVDGKPIDPLNDYERHLYALSLKRKGKSETEIAEALLGLGLTDIPATKRARYISDILRSVIVDFSINKSMAEVN